MSGVNARGEPLDPKESLAYWAVRMSEANPGSPGAALVWAHEEIQRLCRQANCGQGHELLEHHTAEMAGRRARRTKRAGTRPPPCSHCDGPRVIGNHEFRLMTSEAPAAVGGGTAWRWVCSCSPRAIGRWNYQSDSVAYHAWRDHAEKGATR